MWTEVSSLHKNQSQDDNRGFFFAWTCQGLGYSFLDAGSIDYYSLPNFLNSGSDPMTSAVLLVSFSSLKALNREFVWLCDLFLSPIAKSNNYISC
jgi:hypothetical protein